MIKLSEKLMQDVRVKESLTACINCGICSAVCPAAEFYDYDPRKIVSLVQKGDEDEIENLLKSDTIWYCGECMSCVTRCPRNNAAGLIIMALRSLSQDEGLFIESEKGRQQLALKRTIGEWILKHGYCVYPRYLSIENHPEAGPVWEFIQQNIEDVYNRQGANLDGEGQGALRKIPDESLDELAKIFEITGASARFEMIEQKSKEKALQMGLDDDRYFEMIYTKN